MKTFWGHFFTTVLLPVLAQAGDDDFFKQFPSSTEIRIMSLNAHNLFDSKHDDGYFDYTYMPIDHPSKEKNCPSMKDDYYRDLCFRTHWTPKRFREKLDQINKIVKNHGEVPDILALQEVENDHAVERLASRLGYDYFLVTDQPSYRGIDIGLIWNEKKVTYVDAVEVPGRLRNPLRVHFQMNASGEDLFLYINHWPAQMAPMSWRLKNAKAIQQDVDDLLKKKPQANIVMVGDFNVVGDEEKEVLMPLY